MKGLFIEDVTIFIGKNCGNLKRKREHDILMREMVPLFA
jgi:hypothetical protein